MHAPTLDEAVTVRAATAGDAPAIAAIYADAVGGTATFELTPPDSAEIGRRMAELAAGGYPWLVAEDRGEVVAYAYAGPYRARPAYRWTVEDSVYVAAGRFGRGIGRALLESLVAEAAAGGFRQMIAVITDDAAEASIALHKACGFEHVGRLPAVGWKRGRWLATVLMQRPLGEGVAAPPEAIGRPPGANC